MKKYVGLFVVIAIAVLAFMPVQGGVEEEKTAIIKLNEKQMSKYNARDYEATMEVWAHEPYVVHAFTNPPTVGWKAIDERYKKMFSNPNSTAVYTSRTASNVEIIINGNIAFMLYDEHIEYIEEGENKTTDYKALKYFEKKNGEWKVIAVMPR